MTYNGENSMVIGLDKALDDYYKEEDVLEETGGELMETLTKALAGPAHEKLVVLDYLMEFYDKGRKYSKWLTLSDPCPTMLTKCACGASLPWREDQDGQRWALCRSCLRLDTDDSYKHQRQQLFREYNQLGQRKENVWI